MPSRKPSPKSTSKVPPRPGPGRPSKLTPERTEKLTQALRAGASRAGSADFAGIGYRTMFEWMERGRVQPDSEYGKFRKLVNEAESVAELSAVVQVRKDDPKWFLSHRFRRWGDREAKATVTHQGPEGKPLSVVTDAQLLQLLDVLRGAAPAHADSDADADA